MLLSASQILGRVFGLGFVLFALWAALLTSLLGPISSDSPTALMLSIVACVVLHELLHMVSALCVGARKVSIGTWRKEKLILGFYVKIDSELPVSRWLVVALTPLLLLSPTCMLLAFIAGNLREFLVWLSIVNAVGSAGDIALVILAAGAGPHATIRDMGEAIYVEGGSPSRISWMILNALATLGYALFSSFMISQILIAVAVASGNSIELQGIKLIEVVREESRVAATVADGFLLISLLASLATAAIIAFYSWRREQPTYTTTGYNNA